MMYPSEQEVVDIVKDLKRYHNLIFIDLRKLIESIILKFERKKKIKNERLKTQIVMMIVSLVLLLMDHIDLSHHHKNPHNQMKTLLVTETFQIKK